MKRVEAIRAVAMEAEESLIVCNLGFPSRELYQVADCESNFYMLGSMGLASSIGVGLALARPDRRVVAIDGDGSILMNLGTLTTIGRYAPKNFLLVIMDNGVYGSTGCQPCATGCRTKLADLARAAGVAEVEETSTTLELRNLTRSMRSGVVIAKVDVGNADAPLIPLSPREIIQRFTRAVQEESGASERVH